MGRFEGDREDSLLSNHSSLMEQISKDDRCCGLHPVIQVLVVYGALGLPVVGTYVWGVLSLQHFEAGVPDGESAAGLLWGRIEMHPALLWTYYVSISCAVVGTMRF